MIGFWILAGGIFFYVCVIPSVRVKQFCTCFELDNRYWICILLCFISLIIDNCFIYTKRRKKGISEEKKYVPQSIISLTKYNLYILKSLLFYLVCMQFIHFILRLAKWVGIYFISQSLAIWTVFHHQRLFVWPGIKGQLKVLCGIFLEAAEASLHTSRIPHMAMTDCSQSHDGLLL